MQLDRTRIVIRERAMLDSMDLALHVVRFYFAPILTTFAMGAIPLFLLNDLLLVGWMARPLNGEFYTYDDSGAVFRFFWNMSLLVFIQSQVASVFMTAYLGRATFLESPGAGQLVREVFQLSGRWFWCQLILRGVLPACLLLLAIRGDEEFSPGIEFMLLPLLAGGAALLRALRPFITEIVLLERNPLVARGSSAITIARRSNRLHGPSTSDLFVNWIGSAFMAVCLVAMGYAAAVFCQGVLLNDWSHTPLLIRYCLPLSMWIVACYFAVVRFLRYLDLRIRQEGWEVDLLLRAEANRVANRLARKMS